MAETARERILRETATSCLQGLLAGGADGEFTTISHAIETASLLIQHCKHESKEK